MEIFNERNEQFNYTQEQKPLFDAMVAGKVIKSITCMKGQMNKNHPEFDYTLTNVKALMYWVGISFKDISCNEREYFDLIDCEPQIINDEIRDMFYMNNIRSFEL